MAEQKLVFSDKISKKYLSNLKCQKEGVQNKEHSKCIIRIGLQSYFSYIFLFIQEAEIV